MNFSILKTHKKALALAGVILTAVAFTWIFLSSAQPGWYGKIFTVGSSVCHQLETHSFHVGAVQFPVCARCAGLYLGSFIGLIYALATGKRKGIPKTGFLILMAVLFLLWAGDGVNSFMSDLLNRPFLYQTTNLSRLLTGYGMGLVMSTALAALFNITVWESGEKTAMLRNIPQVIGYIGLCAITSTVFLANNVFVFQAAGYIVIATVLTIISLLYAIFWIIALKRENQFSNWKQLVVFLLAGYATAIGQIVLLVALRNKIL